MFYPVGLGQTMSNRIRGKFRPDRTQQRVISNEVVALFQRRGISSRTLTVRSHSTSDSRQKSRVEGSNKSKGESSQKILDKQSSDVEGFIPSKGEVSSYTVGDDFVSAADYVLNKNTELYRRLA